MIGGVGINLEWAGKVNGARIEKQHHKLDRENTEW